jgi:flagellar biosynthesis component FlhA
MKPSVLMVSALANGTAGMVIVLAVARYDIWAVRGASIAFCALFNMMPGLFTFAFTCIMVTMLALIPFRKKQKQKQKQKQKSKQTTTL